MKKQRGFTLIELMVVISIIGTLSSVVLAAVSGTKVKSRDAVRTMEVGQLNTAVQSYTASVGNVPLLKSSSNSLNCDATQTSLNASTVSNCVANSNADPASPQGIAWSNFKSELSAYAPEISRISDPCGINCITSSGTQLGYTYVAPAAMKYICDPANHVIPANSNCPPLSEPGKYNQLYQLYAPNEGASGAVGITPVNVYYAPTSPAQILCPTGQSYNGSSCVSGSVNTLTPSVSITSVTPASVVQTATLSISWSTQNAPAGSAVVLLAYDNSGTLAGRIAQDLPVQGSYSWTVPGPACTTSPNGFKSCTQFSDSVGVNATNPGTYTIIAQLYTPSGGLGGGMLLPSPSLTYLATSPSVLFSIQQSPVTPVIYSITPSTVSFPDLVTVTGSDPSGNFGTAVSPNNGVLINDQPYMTLFTTQTPSSITFAPFDSVLMTNPGITSVVDNIKVKTASGVSNALPITIVMPSLTFSATPSSVAQGQNLNITWDLQNATAGSLVSMILYNFATNKQVPGEILQGLPTQGTVAWPVTVSPGSYQLVVGWTTPSGTYHYYTLSNNSFVLFSVTPATN
ncbi:MAG: type II secretion system protein [Patescibacteria group bacterium]|nr:type II secretion system protein [Patescibacteria group bacterium]MDE2233758.1 type II secretion system protein [Patescibacteria group bacterium]